MTDPSSTVCASQEGLRCQDEEKQRRDRNRHVVKLLDRARDPCGRQGQREGNPDAEAQFQVRCDIMAASVRRRRRASLDEGVVQPKAIVLLLWAGLSGEAAPFAKSGDLRGRPPNANKTRGHPPTTPPSHEMTLPGV